MTRNKLASPAMGRRRFIWAGGALVLASALAPAIARAGSKSDAKSLSFYSLYFHERLKVDYFANGSYIAGAVGEINRIMRDVWTNEITKMDVKLFDLVYDIQNLLDTKETIHIISGYRSPHTNGILAARSTGVAKNSYHLRGMAVDIRVPNRSINQLAEAAQSLKRGGVGLYGGSKFVHVDTGPVRKWG